LKGDSLKVDEVYYDPTSEELDSDYAKHMHVLIISEREEANMRAQLVAKEKEKMKKDYQLEFALERDKRRGLEERISKLEKIMSKDADK